MEPKSNLSQKSESEHKYTSTGIKFWRHKEQMLSYLNKSGNTVISTHISPEGRCNLKCPYCSVSKRKIYNRIDLYVIKDYILRIKSRGLKAVILTGGGEPTLYPYINELVEWIKTEQKLSVAIITNGTLIHKIDKSVWDMFSWVRVSLNFVKGYNQIIKFPKIIGTLGCSMVYTGQTFEQFQEISEFLTNPSIKYIRILPNCLLEQEALLVEHDKIRLLLKRLKDERFFHQFKIHAIPRSRVCHQAYFRPYLSEVNGGTLYPCDSLVLNNSCRKFEELYAICSAEDVLDFLDRKIFMNFNARKVCKGCVFSANIELLNNWQRDSINKFDEFTEELIHEEFV